MAVTVTVPPIGGRLAGVGSYEYTMPVVVEGVKDAGTNTPCVVQAPPLNAGSTGLTAWVQVSTESVRE